MFSIIVNSVEHIFSAFSNLFIVLFTLPLNEFIASLSLPEALENLSLAISSVLSSLGLGELPFGLFLLSNIIGIYIIVALVKYLADILS